MKNLIVAIMAVVALCNAIPANANDPEDYMYVNDVILDNTGVGTVTVYLKTNVEEYNSFMMDLYLPEGFTIVKNRAGKYAFTWNNDEETGSVVDHTMNSADKDGYIRLLGASLSASYILPGDNWIFSFKVQAPDDFKTIAEASFKKIEFAEGEKQVHYFDDVNFTIRPKILTGVEDVTYDADGEDEFIYNLQGIRVNKPLAPGIYIINGKKQLVK